MKTKQQFHIKRVHFSHAQDFDLVIGDGRDHDRVQKETAHLVYDE